jgi:hypothetical protein
MAAMLPSPMPRGNGGIRGRKPEIGSQKNRRVG